MGTKDCPSCLADVPSAALRCKHCFHDFGVRTEQSPGPMIVLWALAAMSLLGALVMTFIVENSITVRYAVDWTTESIHALTTTTTGGTESSSIPFNEIVSIESIEGGDSRYYEVVAVTEDDSRLLLKASDDQPLRSFATATHLAIDSRTVHKVALVELSDDSAGK